MHTPASRALRGFLYTFGNCAFSCAVDADCPTELPIQFVCEPNAGVCKPAGGSQE